MQNTKHIIENKDNKCNYHPDNYQYSENPHYESKDPRKVKHNRRHCINYIVDWIIVLAVATGLVLIIVNAI